MDHVRLRLKISIIILAAVMMLGITGFMLIEDLSLADALYFSVVTVATVGYGDIVPKTTAGRMLATVMIIMGVGTFLGVLGNVAEMFFNRRVKEFKKEKLNMIMGIFFSEVGTNLLIRFSAQDLTVDDIRGYLVVTDKWSEREFSGLQKRIREYGCSIEIKKLDLEGLKDFLEGETDFFLRIFENPYLSEHESFTELLRAVLHVKEELACRVDLKGLPESDYHHLAADIKRAYLLLISEWLDYMKYLKDNYPYLFSLAVRTNPFDQNASAIVK